MRQKHNVSLYTFPPRVYNKGNDAWTSMRTGRNDTVNFDVYTKKLLTQYKNALDVYARHIFAPVKHVCEALSLRTQEHLRRPPTDNLAPIREGETWGGLWQNIWLSLDVAADGDTLGKQIWLIPHTGATEILCFRDGAPSGIINSKNNFIGGMHSAMYVGKSDSPKTWRVDLECYAGHFCPGCAPYDNYGADTPDEKNYRFTFGGLDVCVMDEAINRMVFDLSTVVQLAEMDGDNFVSGRAIRALRAAFPHFIQSPIDHTRGELDAAAEAVSAILAPALEKSAANDGSRGYVSLIGHSHMDTAWLWPYSETIRKCARTYAEALDLMERYPDYDFIQSSALHTWWMEKYYPEIFEGIKRRVAEGRYEPNGGVWVECDCNVTGGEAMARQFIYGQRYTRSRFGYTADCFWLPDTFGYNAAIPQIMRESDVKYFLTTKISWNDMNKMAADTFRWRGLDGSEVLTHFNTMQAIPDPKTVTAAVDQIIDKTTADSRLVAYGFGDGGGGPTYGMLEYMKRTVGLPGLPAQRPETVSAFMNRLDKERERYPIFNGELYLEFHRGTLTSIHDVKRNNRKAEIALHNLEFLAAVSENNTNADIEPLYKELLRNQFHDILPGSSIAEVNDTARAEVSALIGDVNARIAGYLGEASETDLTIVNAAPFSWTESDVFEAEGDWAISGALSQRYVDVMGRARTAISGLRIHAYAAAHAFPGVETRAASPFKYDGKRLVTPLYEAEFDDCGYIASLIERATGRQYAAAMPLGTLLFGENVPDQYENWEISPSEDMKLQPVRALLSRDVVSDGAVEWRVRSVYALSKRSTATVDTVFHAADPAVTYDIKLDWHDRRALVKIAFDANIKSDFVRNEIQFGHMNRPTTRNTSLDSAKFEVVNHRWSDLSDARGGVALLNDCKYGMSAEGGMMTLTLMHGGCRPDPRGDEGVHEMKCAILPHSAPFSTEAVIAPAYKFNMPLIASRTAAAMEPLFSLEGEHVICETVKRAEDVENAYVLRLYECEGVPARCEVSLHDAVKGVERVNFLEEKQCDLPCENGRVSLSLRPFEIATLLVRR